MKPRHFVSITLAAAMGLSTFALPAAAAPVRKVPQPTAEQSRTVEINHRGRYQRVPPGYYRPGPDQLHKYPRRRHPHPGWRHHKGWWYPPAAFSLGVIIGNGLYHGGGYYREPAPRVYRHTDLPPEHYRWCSWRFKTYRAWDNTYIPRVGYRAECRSPYWPW